MKPAFNLPVCKLHLENFVSLDDSDDSSLSGQGVEESH